MPSPPASVGGSPHILAITADPFLLSLVHDLLCEEGYRVTTRSYVDHDLTDISQLAPDLIVLTYMWAYEDDSWSLLGLLSRDPGTAAIPLVLCTGEGREVTAFSGYLAERGVWVVREPVEIDRLLAVVAQALAAGRETPADG